MGRGSRTRGARVQLGNYWLWYRADRDDWCICWLDGRTTRRRSLGIGGGTPDNPPEAAQKALAEHFTANEQSLQYEARPSDVLVEDITRQWLNQHVAHLADPARYAFSVLALERFYEHQRRLGKMPSPFTVATVRSALVRDFISFREREGASAPTISRDLAALRGPINWALGENILASAPRIADVAGRKRSKDIVYGPQEVAAILDAAMSRSDRWHVARYILVAMSTVGRSEAILGLVAETQVRKGLIYFNPPGRDQTAKRRSIVPIAPTLAPWLDGLTGPVIKYEALLAEDSDQAPFSREHIGDIGRAFEACLIEAGERYPNLGFRRPATDDAGNLIRLPPRRKLGETESRPKWKGVGTPNALRHSIHTYLASKGVPKAQIDTASGHATDAGTGDKYNHLRPDYMKELIAAVEQFWKEVDHFTDNHRRPPER